MHLELLMKLLQENVEDQRHGLLLRKRVKWQRLQQKRDLQISMQLTGELRKLEQMMDIQLRQKEFRAAEFEEEVSIGEIREEAVKIKKSCDLKTNELCMFVGTKQGDEQVVEIVEEELNLKAVDAEK